MSFRTPESDRDSSPGGRSRGPAVWFRAMSGLVIGIPHAGVALPPEIQEAVLPHVDEGFLRSQSDAWTDRIYAAAEARCVVYPWSRVVADPNRAEDQRTEGGVLPTTDFAENPLYRPGREPGIHEHHVRILKYHRPYHEEVAAAVADRRTRFYIDAHSMMETAPVRSPDRGKIRPDVVLGDRPSSKMAEFAIGEDESCPRDLTIFAQQRFAHWLLAVPAPPGPPGSAPRGTVTLNDPFSGGYGVASHASPSRGVPGLQVEVNQRLWVVEESFQPIPGRIDWMGEVIARWAGELLAEVARRGSPRS